MSMFRAFDPNAEVLGRNIIAIFNAISGWPMMLNSAQLIVATYDIPDLQLDDWYPQQLLLDILRDISIKLGTGVLHKVGKQIPTDAIFPPEIDSVESALRSINVAYHMNHQNGEIGSYEASEIDPHKIKMVCHNPYPCDFDHGIIDAISRRFAPDDHIVTVSHYPLRPCRKSGQSYCTYLVTWRHHVKPRSGIERLRTA